MLVLFLGGKGKGVGALSTNMSGKCKSARRVGVWGQCVDVFCLWCKVMQARLSTSPLASLASRKLGGWVLLLVLWVFFES